MKVPFVVLAGDVIGEVMDGRRRVLPVLRPAQVDGMLALKTDPEKDATVVMKVIACDPEPGGFVLTLAPWIYEHQPRLLRQGSPLTGGGKARIMSNKRRKPGKAKPPGGKFTEEQARGYTTVPSFSIDQEPEAVDLDDLNVIWRERAHHRHAKAVRGRVDAARQARELLTVEQRIAKAREAARMNYVDVRDEVRALKRMQRFGKSTSVQVERIERLAYREDAA